MSRMVGADIAELRELAASFDGRAAQLRTIENQVSWRVHAAPWHGSDVSRFQHDWNTRHRRSVTTAATSLAEAAQLLRANADQQELASDATYAGRVPSVGGFPPGSPGGVGRVDPDGDEGWISKALEVAGNVVSVADVGVGIAELAEYKNDVRVAGFIQKAGEPLSAIGKLGAWLGPIGAGFDLIEMQKEAAAGDGWGMALSGASAGVGILAWGATMFATIGVGGAVVATAAPIIGIAALAVGAASLIYHNREGIAKVAVAVGTGVANAATWAAGKALDLTHAATEAAGNVVRAGAQTVRQAGAAVGGIARSVVDAGRNFVDGIFRKPAWAPW